jgi:hypothetical protein
VEAGEVTSPTRVLLFKSVRHDKGRVDGTSVLSTLALPHALMSAGCYWGRVTTKMYTRLSGPRTVPSSVRPRRMSVRATGKTRPDSRRWPVSTTPSSDNATGPMPDRSRARTAAPRGLGHTTVEGARRSCGSGFWGGQRPSLAHYVTGMGPMDGATAAGGRSCCLSSRRCPQSFLSEPSFWVDCRIGKSGASETRIARRFLVRPTRG